MLNVVTLSSLDVDPALALLVPSCRADQEALFSTPESVGCHAEHGVNSGITNMEKRRIVRLNQKGTLETFKDIIV